MTSRRGFLGLLGSGIAGALIATELPKFLLFEPAALATASGPIVGIEAITREIAREFERRVGKNVTAVASTARVGNVVGGATMTNHVHVSMNMLQRGVEMKADDFRERYIIPAADALAGRAKQLGLTVFADLPHVGGGAESATARSSRVSVRGVSQYYFDVARDEHLFPMRFDVIGGHA